MRKIESIRLDIDKALNCRANMVLPEDPKVGPEKALLALHPLSEDEVLKLVPHCKKILSNRFVHTVKHKSGTKFTSSEICLPGQNAEPTDCPRKW